LVEAVSPLCHCILEKLTDLPDRISGKIARAVVHQRDLEFPFAGSRLLRDLLAGETSRWSVPDECASLIRIVAVVWYSGQ